jgi:hypothetical protein
LQNLTKIEILTNFNNGKILTKQILNFLTKNWHIANKKEQ